MENTIYLLFGRKSDCELKRHKLGISEEYCRYITAPWQINGYSGNSVELIHCGPYDKESYEMYLLAKKRFNI